MIPERPVGKGLSLTSGFLSDLVLDSVGLLLEEGTGQKSCSIGLALFIS